MEEENQSTDMTVTDDSGGGAVMSGSALDSDLHHTADLDEKVALASTLVPVT